jgi:hypothetical protein
MSEAAHPRARTALSVVLPTVLVCLGVLEVGLRAIGRPPATNTDAIFEAYGQGSYRLKRNISFRSVSRSFSFTIHTNEFGLRDRAPGPRRLVVPYIAWMGDSATFGNGVDYQESFVGLFEDFAARRGIGVVNLAMGGHHISDQEDTLREFLAEAPRPPTRVIFVFTPQVLALFDGRYDDLMVKDGYLFPRKGWRIPYLRVILGSTSSAYCFFRDAIRRVQYRLLPDSWRKDPLAALSKPSPDVGRSVAARAEAKLQELDEQIRNSGATPVYVFLPTSIDLRRHEQHVEGRKVADDPAGPAIEAMRRHVAASGIQLVDLSPALRTEFDTGRAMTFAEDPHFIPSVHRIIVQVLNDQILGRDAPPSPGR